jgi:hypothetical protein
MGARVAPENMHRFLRSANHAAAQVETNAVLKKSKDMTLKVKPDEREPHRARLMSK